MKYFTLYEFVRSDTAAKLKIDNLPSDYQITNCNELVDNLLDPLREAWAQYCEDNDLGTPAIIVTSGIRSKELNEAVNGSETSAHYHGWAADIVPRNGKLLIFKNFCINWLFNNDIRFDQFISEDEDDSGVPGWIHIGYKNGVGKQRRQFKYMRNGKYYYIDEYRYNLTDMLMGNYL